MPPLDLDALAAEMAGMGFGEYVDFFITSRADGIMVSSEFIGLYDLDGVYEVFLRDMGKSHDILTNHRSAGGSCGVPGRRSGQRQVHAVSNLVVKKSQDVGDPRQRQPAPRRRPRQRSVGAG
jgi:hypothetical protein